MISETSAPYVHDFIIYGCPDDLNEVDAEGSLCDDASNETVACLGGVIVAAWAEHGEVHVNTTIITSIDVHNRTYYYSFSKQY